MTKTTSKRKRRMRSMAMTNTKGTGMMKMRLLTFLNKSTPRKLTPPHPPNERASL